MTIRTSRRALLGAGLATPAAPGIAEALSDRVAREAESWRQIARTANITAGWPGGGGRLVHPGP